MKHTCDRYALCQIRKSGKSYRAMERAYREGKVRAIGVSNFYPDRFIDLQEHVEAQKYMEKYGCHIMSWGPFVVRHLRCRLCAEYGQCQPGK